MKTQSEDFKYFVDHHDELLNCYRNKFIVIANREVCFSADTFEEAFNKAVGADMKLGSFIIQKCTEGDSAYTQMFHSRAIFA